MLIIQLEDSNLIIKNCKSAGYSFQGGIPPPTWTWASPHLKFCLLHRLVMFLIFFIFFYLFNLRVMPLKRLPPGRRLTLTETTGTRYLYSTGQALMAQWRSWKASLCPEVILVSSPCTVVRSTFFFRSSVKAPLVSLSFSDTFVFGFAFVTFVAITVFFVFVKGLSCLF